MSDSGTMPVLELVAHMRDRPVRVWVYRDRIEWQPKLPGILARGIAAATTEGATEVFADETGKAEMQTFPVGWIAAVTTERVLMHTRVAIVGRGDRLELDLSSTRAAELERVLLELIEPSPPAAR